jgi:(p)ppGpp synthase/HD superfamily hydrolase
MSCVYSELFISKIEEQNNQNQVNLNFIKKGLSFAKHYHAGQFRKSGEPYYSHPIIVAEMVSNHMFRENTIIAALLHDTLEDTNLALSEIELEFNPRIAQMVNRLTRKIDAATGKKMSAGECLLEAQKLGDTEVMLIKACDRAHNLQTSSSLSLEKQQKILKETTEYFFPIFFNLLGKNIV